MLRFVRDGLHLNHTASSGSPPPPPPLPWKGKGKGKKWGKILLVDPLSVEDKNGDRLDTSDRVSMCVKINERVVSVIMYTGCQQSTLSGSPR